MPVFNWFKVTSGTPGQRTRDQRQTQHTTVITEWETAYYSTQEGASITQGFSQNHPHSPYAAITNNVPYHDANSRLRYSSPPQASLYSAPDTHESHQAYHPSHANPIAYSNWRVTYVVPHNHDNRSPAQRPSFDRANHAQILPEIIFAIEQNRRRTTHEEEQEYVARMTCAPLIRCIPLPPFND